MDFKRVSPDDLEVFSVSEMGGDFDLDEGDLCLNVKVGACPFSFFGAF